MVGQIKSRAMLGPTLLGHIDHDLNRFENLDRWIRWTTYIDRAIVIRTVNIDCPISFILIGLGSGTHITS